MHVPQHLKSLVSMKKENIAVIEALPLKCIRSCIQKYTYKFILFKTLFLLPHVGLQTVYWPFYAVSAGFAMIMKTM